MQGHFFKADITDDWQILQPSLVVYHPSICGRRSSSLIDSFFSIQQKLRGAVRENNGRDRQHMGDRRNNYLDLVGWAVCPRRMLRQDTHTKKK